MFPDNVRVPVPAFVMPPVPDMTPEMVSAELLTVICRTAPPRSMAPVSVSAPVPPDDWPRMKSAPTTMSLAIVLAVPEDEERVPPAIVSVPVPNAPSSPARSIPDERVVPPEYVLAFESVSVPVPAFVMPPVPDMTPEMVSAELLTVICRTAPPRSMAPVSVSAPVPPDDWPRMKSAPTTMSLAIVLAVPEDEERVPPAIVSVPVPNAELFPTLSVPSSSAVPPEYVFVPVRVRTPVPVFVRLPEPVPMTPEMFVAPVPATARLRPVPDTAPLTVRAVVPAPLFVAVHVWSAPRNTLSVMV